MNDKGWVRFWGSMIVSPKSFYLGATASTTGGSVFLDGTYTWADYRFDATISRFEGNTLSLLARLTDELNYVACNYSERSVAITQRLRGQNRVMVRVALNTPATTGVLGIKVKGNKVECIQDNKIIAYAYYLSPVLSQGGVGIKIWAKENGMANVEIEDIEVTNI